MSLVSDPIEMRLTPVSAMARTVSRLTPPEASRAARPAVTLTASRKPARSKLSSSISFAPAAAIGAKMGAPERKVVCLVGDGGLLSVIGALTTSVELGIPVLWVLFNNFCFSTIRTVGESYFDNSYGTPREPVETALSAGQDVLFDIDWQGTQQLKEKARDDVVSVFILPPSAADLEKRLHSRAQDSEAVIRSRMSRATHELSHWAEYDYIVINHDIDEAFAEIQSILKAERLKRERRTGLTTFVRELQRQLEK